MKKNDGGKSLAELALDPGFSRNYTKMMMERENGDPGLKELITSALVTATAERVTGKQRHAKASAKGGESRKKEKQGEWQQRDAKIVSAAKAILARDGARRNVAGILAQTHGLTPRRINQILKKEGI